MEERAPITPASSHLPLKPMLHIRKSTHHPTNTSHHTKVLQAPWHFTQRLQSTSVLRSRSRVVRSRSRVVNHKVQTHTTSGNFWIFILHLWTAPSQCYKDHRLSRERIRAETLSQALCQACGSQEVHRQEHYRYLCWQKWQNCHASWI